MAQTQADEFEELPEHEPAWLVLERATKCRKRLLAAGFRPLPVNGKAPPIPGWQDVQATDKIIVSWEQYIDATNSGILTINTPGLDVDIMVPEAADAIEALAREHFEERGYILVRFGRAPKRVILLRTDEPFKKIVRQFTAPDSSEQQIEILGHGQQVVVAGIHPDTGKPYSWHGGEPGESSAKTYPMFAKPTWWHSSMPPPSCWLKTLVSKRRRTAANRRPTVVSRRGPTAEPPESVNAIRRGYAGGMREGAAAIERPGRNRALNTNAFKLGRMVARGWIDRADGRSRADRGHAHQWVYRGRWN